MYALKTFYFGHNPIARPNTFLAFQRSLQRRQKLAQKIHSLPNVNFLCGTIFIARQNTCSARAISPATSSSNTAQLNHIYIYLLQNRFYSTGGFYNMAAQQTSRTRSMFLLAYYRKIRFSHASQLSEFRAIRSLQRLLRSPSTTSSISCWDPCSFQKFRYIQYNFLAASLARWRSPNLNICLARQYSRSLIQNLAKSMKQLSWIASMPSSVITLQQILRVASRLRFLNQNLATFKQVSRWGKASRYLQRTAFDFSGQPILSQYLMQAIHAFSPGHQSIHRLNTSLAFTYQPINYSIQEYLNQN